ncbi:hypothetical protein EVAR_57939_1 [Eumeta japonica]|uniref:Uncharacterized protein n=1 Tax=Eumeta variegata TaxID=151549 RepID=A0A4C1ZN22_EUMVA|nr:hypothetical protein EVAR_57939_1 [Eumeta japonica]
MNFSLWRVPFVEKGTEDGSTSLPLPAQLVAGVVVHTNKKKINRSLSSITKTCQFRGLSRRSVASSAPDPGSRDHETVAIQPEVLITVHYRRIARAAIATGPRPPVEKQTPALACD